MARQFFHINLYVLVKEALELVPGIDCPNNAEIYKTKDQSSS